MSTATRWRRWAIVAGLASLVLAGGWWVAGAASTTGETRWHEATVEDLVIGVPVEGTLASADTSILTPPPVSRMFDFKITMMAPEGEEVGAGTPVLAFDTSELERRLRDRQTEAEQAAKTLDRLEVDLQRQLMDLELEVEEARAELRKARLKVDVPQDLTSARELERARLDVELAELEVESLEGRLEAARRSGEARRAVLEGQKTWAERRVEEIRESIERMTVKAPRPSTVIYVTNWRGEKKKVGDSAWRHEGVIELPNLRAMMARGEVDEADGGRVEMGQPVRIRLDAHPELEYAGAVSSIWRTVRRKSDSRNPVKVFRLDVELEETDLERMRPGMRYRGTVETERLEDVLTIPLRAVFPAAEGPVVYRRTLFGSEVVPVELGRRDEDSVQVLGGLEVGDRVAGSPVEP